MKWFKKSATSKPVQKSKDELYNYWRNPDEMNDPAGYFEGNERSVFLLSLVKQTVSTDASIIELGCNVGRNLHHLWQAGYHNLSGVELNEQAIKLMRERFPEMQIPVYQGTIEDRIKELGQHDLVFTMAVLEHIHKDSEWIFTEIARVTKKYMITIEDERNISERHFPRNYRQVFEELGLHQISEKHLSKKEGLNLNFYARVFIK
jgi:2-polyprenyl-3-methyl-5-hydroxy-6-metoxy-1,4-benzoquinol methylase